MTLTYYQRLEITQTATSEEIRSAFRKKAKLLHPDINKAPDAQERFKEVDEAYQTLKDASKRRDYDLSLKRGTSYTYTRSSSSTSYTSSGRPLSYEEVEAAFKEMERKFAQMDSMFDSIDSMFGGKKSRREPKHSPEARRQQQQREAELSEKRAANRRAAHTQAIESITESIEHLSTDFGSISFKPKQLNESLKSLTYGLADTLKVKKFNSDQWRKNIENLGKSALRANDFIPNMDVYSQIQKLVKKYSKNVFITVGSGMNPKQIEKAQSLLAIAYMVDYRNFVIGEGVGLNAENLFKKNLEGLWQLGIMCSVEESGMLEYYFQGVKIPLPNKSFNPFRKKESIGVLGS